MISPGNKLILSAQAGVYTKMLLCFLPETFSALWPLALPGHDFSGGGHSENSTPIVFLGHILVPQLFMAWLDNPHIADIKITPWLHFIVHEMKVHKYVDEARHPLLKFARKLFIVIVFKLDITQ